MVSAADIPPGGEGKIEVTVNTRGRRGQLVKTVTVSSNDPQTPNLILRVKGNIEVVAGFEPERLNLQHLALGSETSKEVKITAREPDKFKVLEITSNQPDRLTVEPKPDSPLTYLVKVKAGDKPGRFSATIKAKTNLKSPAEIVLPVYGTVSQDLVLDRAYVFLSTPRLQGTPVVASPLAALAQMLKNRGTMARVRVSSLSGKPFRIERVEDPSGVLALYQKQGQDGWYLYLAALRPPQQGRGQVFLHTDRSDQPKLTLNYSVRRAQRVPAFAPGRSRPGALRAPGAKAKHPVLRLAPRLRKPALRLAPGGQQPKAPGQGAGKKPAGQPAEKH